VTAIPLGAVHPRHGTHEPTSGTPLRTPGSVRRTATTDMLRPEGLSGPLVLLGRARDLVTGAGGTGRVVAEASSRVRIDFTGGRVIEAIETTPPRPALAALVGVRASSGFRTAALAADPALPEENGLLNLLLDDIPVTTLVSGHAWGAGTPVERRLPVVTMRSHLIRDQCAGFADGATIMAEVDRTGLPPLVTGPAALPLVDPSADDADPDGWHPTDPLPPHGMRRTRRLDVRPGTPTVVDVLFRDSYVRPDGLETVIHEYTVAMEVDSAAGVVLACEATPRVLPWQECPAAALSARRLAGQPLAGLRQHVRETFGGTSTCTHLNDTLRSLEDVPALLSLVAG
jgi:hypothetical protein